MPRAMALRRQGCDLKLVVDNAKLENYYDRKQPVPEKGPIQLQTHGGEIRWRNIFIKGLSK